MKKIIATVLLLFSILWANTCYAFSELYYLKNSNKTVMDNKLNNLFLLNNYTLKQKNPFYALQTKDTSKYAIAILQQSGTNLFYYYTTNANDKKVHKAFLKDLEAQGISYLQSSNIDLLNNFDAIAQKTLTGSKTIYTFEDNRYTNSSATVLPTKKNNNELSGYIAMVGKNDKLNAYLQNPINTATAKEGDEVQAVLKSDWVTTNNKVIAPQGSVLFGTLSKAKSASVGMRNGSVSINFTKITTPENVSYDLTTQKIDFNVSNEGIVGKTVTKAVAAAALGALMGVAVGALSKDSGAIAKGAIIGASIGGGGALATSALESGVDAEIPSYTDLEIVVEKDIRVVFKD